MNAKQIIEHLGLKALPHEGGFFREIYRAEGTLPQKFFNGEQGGERNFSTAILFLITSDDFSALHRITQDEIFHFYLGDRVEMIQIDPIGNIKKIILGPNILNGERVQVAVLGETWQGLKLVEGGEWALLGTTVAPGFDFRDFLKGERKTLLEKYPQHQSEILKFTRE